MASGEDLTVRRRRTRQCVAFFAALAELCDDPDHSAEEIFEEVRQSARGFAQWAEEIIMSSDPDHPLDFLLSPLRDTFLVESGRVGDIPLTLKKARWCAKLIAPVLQEIAEEGAPVYGGRPTGGGHSAGERRARAPVRINRY